MKALVHAVSRAGAEGTFDDRIRELASAMRRRPEAHGLQITTMLRLPGDPLGRSTRYRATLELRSDTASPDVFPALLDGFDASLQELAHVDLCTALVGEDVRLRMTDERASVRYQYLMRRNAKFDHTGYLERYRSVHARFGLETPGTLGYVQFHVDTAASRRLAKVAGLGVWNVDSVSELHLESLEVFLEAVTRSNVGARAAEDEEQFVDRPCSYDFCSLVDWRD